MSCIFHQKIHESATSINSHQVTVHDDLRMRLKNQLSFSGKMQFVALN